MKKLFLIMVLGLAGCSYLPSPPAGFSELYEPKGFGTMSPMPQFMRDVPQGQDSFSQGWRDGCNTYVGFTGSGLIQMRGFTYDINRSLRDKQYASGFREGANLCMYFTDTRPN